MPIEVNLPKLSPTMESGQLVKWLVKVGDKVREGDTLAEVQTDKAVMPMEASDDGVVAVLDAAEGQDIALGERVLVLATKGEDPKQVAEQSKTKPAAKPADATAEPAAATAQSHSNGRSNDAAPVAAAVSPGGRVKSSPLARKVALEAGADIATIPGTGPGGRVIRRDVESFLKQRTEPRAAARATAAGERIPHSPMRKTIAARMLQSKTQIPEIHVVVDARIDNLLSVRETLNKQLAAEKIKLSVGDFITRAAAQALRQHPALNASFEPDAIVRHADVNIGIAVALENGLIVPVLHNADQLGLREIRLGTEAIAAAARNNKLTPKQMMGGTFTISNLGMYGIKHFDAIINQPEVGILAVGAGEKRPVVEGDQIVPGTVMTLTLSADHRAVDGAVAAEFMRTLKGFLEEPSSMLL